MLPGDEGIAEIGGVALLPFRAAGELVVDEQRGGSAEDAEGLELGRGAGRVAGQCLKDVLKQDQAVGPEDGPGNEQGTAASGAAA